LPYLSNVSGDCVWCMQHLIGKETERGWSQAEDISTLLPSLVHYHDKRGEAGKHLQELLKQTSLNALRRKTSLSKHTIRRARNGQTVRTRSLQVLARASLPPA
jgi:hypothetical protein